MTFYYALECNNQLIEEQLVRTQFQKHNVNKDSVQSQWRGAGRRDGVCNEALLGHLKMACRIALKIAMTYFVTICQQSIICYSNDICTTTRNSNNRLFVILMTCAQQEIQQSIICYSNNIYTRYSNKIYTTRNSTIDYFILTTFAQQEIQPSPLLSPNFSVINISPCERSA